MKRTLRPERMDDPNLDGELHRAALVGLARLNRVSGSARVLWPPIRQLARSLNRPLKLLDIATGGGDVPVRLWQLAQRIGTKIELEACDVSSRALQFAQLQAERARVPLRLHRIDVLNDELPSGFDCVTCSLFLHHLTEEQVVRVLRKMSAASQRVVLVNDLVRSRLSLFQVYLATRLLSRSAVVRTDGPLSIHAAFTLQEARRLAEIAGLHGARIAPRHPCRFLLTWSR